MEDYKIRFINEYHELNTRYIKLHDMIIKYNAKTLDFTPTCPIELLKEQLAVMWKYLYLLEIRAQIEKIDLSESEEKNIMGGCIYSYPLADKYFSTTDSAPMEMKFLNEEEQEQMDSQIHKISKISKEKCF